jgi:hypothetical protein
MEVKKSKETSNSHSVGFLVFIGDSGSDNFPIDHIRLQRLRSQNIKTKEKGPPR